MSPKIPARWSWNVWNWNAIKCRGVLQIFKDIHHLAFFFHHDATALASQVPLIVEDPWSNSVRHTTVGRTPLHEWSARRNLYLTTHNTHNRQTSMPPAGFKPAIPTSERPQTHALDRAATGIGIWRFYFPERRNKSGKCNNNFGLMTRQKCCARVHTHT